MARKRSQATKDEPATYIVKITSYSADYSFSLADKKEDHPYHEYLWLELHGHVTATTSKKVLLETPVKLHVMSESREIDPDCKPRGVGHLDMNQGKLEGSVSIPQSSIPFLFSILESKKAEVADLFGTEIYRRQIMIRSFRVTTNFEWSDWQ